MLPNFIRAGGNFYQTTRRRPPLAGEFVPNSTAAGGFLFLLQDYAAAEAPPAGERASNLVLWGTSATLQSLTTILHGRRERQPAARFFFFKLSTQVTRDLLIAYREGYGGTFYKTVRGEGPGAHATKLYGDLLPICNQPTPMTTTTTAAPTAAFFFSLPHRKQISF